MDHKWLEDFLMLARERNFSKAAALRHVTQPQFSRRIRALELWAGAELVNRAGVPMSLTPAGDTLLASSKVAVNALADARERIARLGGGGNWTTLFTGRTLSRTVVPLLLARVRKQLGDVPLRLMTGSIHDGAIALEQGGADFLLSFAHPRLALALDDQQFEGITLAHDELVAISAPLPSGKPQHALPGTANKPVKALSFAPQLALAQILQDGLSRARLPLYLQVITESDFAESLHEQALQGAGMAWLPRALVAADLKAGRLVLAGKSIEPIRYEIRLYRPRHMRKPHLQKIWDAVV
ncbi:MAG: LysR family transcriptional regulator [Vitreoscilla sp.]|nr:LysR family transcriptional regulator [Polaromonas sp.]